MDERDLRTEAGKDVRELDRDVAAAEDSDAPRQSRQMKGVIRRDPVAGRLLRCAAGRDENASRGDDPSANVDRMWVLQHRAAGDDFASRLLQPGCISARQSLD